MIHIVSTFYISNTGNHLDKLRNEELFGCVINNMNNKMIQKIHFFVDDNHAVNKLKSLQNEENYYKIHIAEIGKRAKHIDYFEYARTYLKGEICMIANTDIWLYQAPESVVMQVKNSPIAYALSRYEHDMSCPQINYFWGSHDAYIFNPEHLTTSLELVDYYPNITGIETRIIKLLVDNHYKVYNPSYAIKIVHMHACNMRNYSSGWIGLHDYHDVTRYMKSAWYVPPCKVNIDLCEKALNKVSKKVISFSLWGDQPNYCVGAIKNAELASVFYNNFECWFYIHKETVPEETVHMLSQMKNVKIIMKTGDLLTCKPMMWRFEAIDDPEVDVMLVRDTDTRFLLRERLAVDEWLISGKLFHIMRDHPHHAFTILGGMFGTKKIPAIPSWKNAMDTFVQTGHRDYDQSFLRDIIYPHIVNDSMIHASFNAKESHCKNFPIPYDNECRFVGEYVYFDESRSMEHVNILRNSIGRKGV